MSLAAALLAAPAMFAQNQLYLIGQPQGWDINSDDMTLEKVEDGVFQASYYIEEGQFQFRFYSELGDWESNSIGAQDQDNPVQITLTDGKYEGSCVYGKGAWEITNWGGADVLMTVNLNDMTVEFVSDGEVIENPEPSELALYVRGGFNDWGTSDQLNKVSETLYSGVFNITMDEFEFKIADANWSSGSNFGAEEDNSTFNLGDVETATLKAVDGSNTNFTVVGWSGGELKFTIDLASFEITVGVPTGDEPVGPGPVEPSDAPDQLYMIGGPFGWNESAPVEGSQLTLLSDGVFVIKNVEMTAESYFAFTSDFGSWDIVNANRVAPAEKDAPFSLTSANEFVLGVDASWKMEEAGTYSLMVNFNNKTVSLYDESGVASIDSNNTVFTVYTLQGTRVLNNASSLDNLNKGIYIVNGKKVVIK